MTDSNVVGKKYRKDFLANVIVKIDFDTPLSISKKGPSKKVYNPVKERFPITEENKIVGKELLVGPKVTKEREIETKEWLYFGKKREKHLKITPRFMAITYDKYEYYEKLRSDFLSVSDALFDSYPKLHVKRLGLRYIDKINFSRGIPTEWKGYLKPELYSIFNLAKNKDTVSRAFHVLEYNFGDDLVRFQFGMFNSDYPAPIKAKEYTLDFDMYINKILDKSEIEITLDRFHSKASDFFEEVIEDKLRDIMGPIDE